MRSLKGMVLLVALLLAPGAALAQGDRNDRRIQRLMDRLREELFAFRQELEYFRRAPEYNTLVEHRYRVRNLAILVADLEPTGPVGQRAQRELAPLMEAEAIHLKRLAGNLENRTDAGSRLEVRRRADVLKARADKIREMIGQLRELVR